MSSVVKGDTCQVFTVRFERFEDLPAVNGQDCADSPEFTCFGHRWKVQVWPGGGAHSNDGKVAVFLKHVSDGCIEVQATFAVAESKTKCAAYFAMRAKKFQAAGEQEDKWGKRNFATRSIIIGALRDGALVIELLMKQTESKPPLPFVPVNPAHANTLKKFGDDGSSDVIFEVSSGEVEEGGSRKRKRDKVPSTTFHAHRFVLLDNAPALAQACESSSGLTPIPITGVEPEIFHHVLFYLYGGKVDDEELKVNAKEIIDAADKFGVVGLKLAAEAAFVTSTTISINNVMDNLLYADAKNCPLLKEAVMDFVVENGDDVAKKLSFDILPGGLMKDLLTAMNVRDKRRDSGAEKGEPVRDFHAMRVSMLRSMLDEKGLEVDGSREAMIAALEGYTSNGFPDLSSSAEEEG